MNLLDALKSLNVPFEETPFEKEIFSCEEVADFLGISTEQVAKSMLVEIKKIGLLITVIPGNKKLEIGLLRNKFKEHTISLVHSSKVERSIGLPVGAVTPLIFLINPSIKVIIDNSLKKFNTLNISSGDLRLGINISVIDLAKLTSASFDDICIS